MNVTLSVAPSCQSNWLPSLDQIKAWLEVADEKLTNTAKVSISIHIADSSQARELNLRYRGKDYATNVLSFPADLPEAFEGLLEDPPLGEILLCPSVIEAEAKEQNKQLSAHWAHLLIHGFLHLNGYDHASDTEAQCMESLESQALKSLGLPDPYLIV